MTKINIKSTVEELVNTFLIAGKTSLELRKKGLIKNIKSDNTPVTNGDLEVNKIITDKISELSPKMPIISEETSENRSINDLNSFWLIDPIDGTSDYINNLDEFTINAGLIINKRPAAGLIYAPAKKRMFYSFGKDQSYEISNHKKIKLVCKKLTPKNSVKVVSYSNEIKPEIKKIKESPKWQRAIKTVEWIGAQLPLDSEFQVFGFNEQASSLTNTTNSKWIAMEDGLVLNEAVQKIKEIVPSGGTSLENLVKEITSLSPLPDNVYLITDGLPTLSDRPARSALVTGRKRIEYFRDAISRLPKQIPINIILFPIEGDPMAAAEFWNLARITNGAFISPSRDWP